MVPLPFTMSAGEHDGALVVRFAGRLESLVVDERDERDLHDVHGACDVRDVRDELVTITAPIRHVGPVIQLPSKGGRDACRSAACTPKVA